MSLTFYRAPMSTATVTELVLAELGIPHETVTLDIKKGDTKKPEFLKINPNGKVPVVVHEGSVIWESSAITMYLGETFGVEKNLYPAPGPKRGEAMGWIAWAGVSLTEAVYRYARNVGDWSPPEQRNAKTAEVALGDVQGLLGMLDEAVRGKDFLLGSYTLVDAHVNSLLDWLRYMSIDMSRFDHLNAWSARCSSRPAHKKVMEAAMASAKS